MSTGIGSAIDGQLITRLSQIAGVRTARLAASSEAKFSSSDQVSTTLNSGGRTFANAFNSLNRAANFVSVGIDTLQQLDKLVTKVIAVAEKGARIGTGAAERGNITAEYKRLGRQFAQILEAADQAGDYNPLSEADIEEVLINVGLDKERSLELASLFRNLKTIDGDTVLADDRVRDPRPIQPTVDESEEDPTTLGNVRRFSQVFEGSRTIQSRDDARVLIADAKMLQRNLQTNIAGLQDVTQHIIDNMELVRTTALAMLDGSRDRALISLRDAPSVADAIRSQVASQGKPAALRQAGNLDRILAASLVANEG